MKSTEGAQTQASFRAGFPIRSLLQGTIAVGSFLSRLFIARPLQRRIASLRYHRLQSGCKSLGQLAFQCAPFRF